MSHHIIQSYYTTSFNHSYLIIHSIAFITLHHTASYVQSQLSHHTHHIRFITFITLQSSHASQLSHSSHHTHHRAHLRSASCFSYDPTRYSQSIYLPSDPRFPQVEIPILALKPLKSDLFDPVLNPIFGILYSWLWELLVVVVTDKKWKLKKRKGEKETK